MAGKGKGVARKRRSKARWNWFSVGRVAALLGRGKSRRDVAEHYFLRYGRAWGIKSVGEMQDYLFLPKRGVKSNFAKLFEGKTPKEIRESFKAFMGNRAKTRAKMSEAKRGKLNPMFGKRGELSPRFGKKHSAETRAKMSAARLGKLNPRFGKTHSAGTLQKMSEVQLRRWERVRAELLRSFKERGLVPGVEPRAEKGRKRIVVDLRTPERAVAKRERDAIIQDAVGGLPPLESRVVVRVYFDGETVEAVAKELGKPVNSVRGALDAALRKLSKNKRLRQLL